MPTPFIPDTDFIALQQALAGEYSLERELGRGGMGIVYLAREVSLDRLVAIKILPPHLAAQPELRQRFVREAQTAARLSHPNIVPIFRVGEAGEYVYFAMAYVEGQTLTQRVRERGPLPPHEAARILREAAWGLAYAHARGIVHRDVKPDNILLESGSGRAMLTDFGIAHVESSAGRAGLTEVGLVLGTAQFMSPEQATGEKLDGRSDLYSLGVVAHFAISGRLPFEADSTPALLAKHLTQPAPALASVAPGAPRSLADAVDRCLAKDPAQRFQTGEMLADALSVTDVVRDVPAPLRIWVGHESRMQTVRIVFGMYALALEVPLVVRYVQTPASAHHPFSLVKLFLPVAIAAVVAVLPTFFSTRRTLAAGYTLDDIRGALRQHWNRRQEEIQFEQRLASPALRRIVWSLAALGWGTMTAALYLGRHHTHLELTGTLAASGGIVGGVTTIFGTVNLARTILRERIGRWNLRFWMGRGGARIAALAGRGLKRTNAPARPQLTEVALGRATDVLFEALPKAVRGELRALPGCVRQLEHDASALRADIERVDAQLATVQLDDRPASPRSISASVDRDPALARNRAAVHADLTSAREALRARLAETVTALENIRLGLLRLQIGSVGVDSITSVLEAAQRIGEDVKRRVAAELEVQQALATQAPPPSIG